MKRLISMAIMLATASCLMAQTTKEIQLQTPNTDRGSSIMKSLADRQSVRECADRELSLSDLSDLLWAANGVNRPATGKRTAPSAMNLQEVDVYAILPQGAYKYDAQNHKLVLLAEGDYRQAVASRQDFVTAFPMSLVLVSDLSKYRNNDDHAKLMAAADAGYVSQNICLFCSGVGLVTVPRATMDETVLREALKLTDSQVLMLNNPVGYPKE